MDWAETDDTLSAMSVAARSAEVTERMAVIGIVEANLEGKRSAGTRPHGVHVN